MGDLTNNFSSHEFACKCGCGLDNIDWAFVCMLQDVRDEYGSMTITSGLRCEHHNKDSGGYEESPHLGGWAADIKVDNSSDRYRLIKIASRFFVRMGIAKNFIHLDCDPSKVSGVIWVYS